MMYAMRKAVDVAAPGSVVAHLLDAQAVMIPYLTVGHHRRDDPAASPVVSRLVAAGDELARHPYTGAPMALERLAHHGSCPTCNTVWEHLEQILDTLPEGTHLYEPLPVPVFTVHGAAHLIVSVTDEGPNDSDPMVVAA